LEQPKCETFLTVLPKQTREEEREITTDNYNEEKKKGKKINKTRWVNRANVGKQLSGERED
jgi:hypothetical protein